MKTIEDFKRQAKEKNITRWNIHECSLCGYNCGYLIRGDEVFYDAGCYCTGRESVQHRTWDDLARAYNMNAGAPDVEERMKKNKLFAQSVKEDNEFWGF